MRGVVRWLLLLVEGLRFLRSITPRWRLLPPHDYLHWRLVTVYGSFDRESGVPRPVRVMLVDLWRDRSNVAWFLA